MGKAMHDYGMLQDGDRIAVGVSGGKDSWALLWLLAQLRQRAPLKFELFPIHIDPGFQEGPADAIKLFGRRLGFEVVVEHTDHGVIAHSEANRENPCFLCSRLRRKRLFEISDHLGCRKLALGHHKDDVIETLFLNLCYAGEISTMLPSQAFFNGDLTVIRPLAYADETLLQQYADEMQWPVKRNPCPSANSTKRSEVKQMLHRLYDSNPNIKGNIFRALRHVKLDYLLK
jgi:tRNA 2-thiocytidine biosynthesis protein TtcA